MSEFEISEIVADWKEVEQEVLTTIDDTAAALGKPFPDEGLVLRATGDDGFLGGLVGDVLQGWLYVKYLGIVPVARGRGIGSELMQRAEAWAVDHGLVGTYVDTFDFQAPEFYANHGYSEIGRLPSVGGQPARIWFAKAFSETLAGYKE